MRSQIIDSTRLKYANGKVYIRPTFGTEILVGTIEKDVLRIKDEDNYHKSSDSLGVDKAVLFSKLLNYTRIVFKFHGYVHETTRKYFVDKSYKKSLMNGRDLLFMRMRDIRLDKGLAHDKKFADSYNFKYSIPQNLKDMDIFDVFTSQRIRGINNNRLLRMWEKIIK